MKTQLVIFGLTGDLGQRKLLPALDWLLRSGEVQADNLEIIGISRREINASKLLTDSLGADQAKKSLLSPILSFVQMNLADLDDYASLRIRLARRAGKGAETQTLFYLSVPPNSAAKISELLGKAGLNTPNHKILFEKPFGVDLGSAEDFLERTHQYFSEKQILRVDHYLMKQPVRKLQALFEQNQILGDIAQQKQIEKIEIIASEQLDIEGRGIFYEQTGAVRDFIQNHLISILAGMLASNSPDFRAARAKALASILPISDYEHQAVRAQYQGYRKEVGSEKSTVETFAKITLISDNDLWKNVPLVLVSGKALKQKTSEVRIYFSSNRRAKPLVISLAEQPHEPAPYAQVFLDALASRTNFFVSQREILESWRIFDAILDYWQFQAETGLKFYKKGSDWQNVWV